MGSRPAAAQPSAGRTNEFSPSRSMPLAALRFACRCLVVPFAIVSSSLFPRRTARRTLPREISSLSLRKAGGKSDKSAARISSTVNRIARGWNRHRLNGHDPRANGSRKTVAAIFSHCSSAVERTEYSVHTYCHSGETLKYLEDSSSSRPKQSRVGTLCMQRVSCRLLVLTSIGVSGVAISVGGIRRFIFLLLLFIYFFFILFLYFYLYILFHYRFVC